MSEEVSSPPDQFRRDMDLFFELNPSLGIYRYLKVEYAERIGGVFLQHLKLTEGENWGIPSNLSLAESSRILGVKESDLVAMHNEMLDETIPKWKAKPLYEPPRGKRLTFVQDGRILRKPGNGDSDGSG